MLGDGSRRSKLERYVDITPADRGCHDCGPGWREIRGLAQSALNPVFET